MHISPELDSKSHKITNYAKESNFKVVIRVRPPLKREMPTKSDRDENGQPLKFLPCTDISEDAKYCTLLEYLGSEVSEKQVESIKCDV